MLILLYFYLSNIFYAGQNCNWVFLQCGHFTYKDLPLIFDIWMVSNVLQFVFLICRGVSAKEVPRFICNFLDPTQKELLGNPLHKHTSTPSIKYIDLLRCLLKYIGYVYIHLRPYHICMNHQNTLKHNLSKQQSAC